MTEALEVIREQSKAEQQEKLDIIAPLVKRLQLRNPEVDALLKLPKKNLKALNKKVEDRLNEKIHKTTVIHDPTKPANLLWAVAKQACPSDARVVPNKRYNANLSGVQVLACFAAAKQLYALAQEKKDAATTSLSTGNKTVEEQK
jgi:hypothetical protein